MRSTTGRLLLVLACLWLLAGAPSPSLAADTTRTVAPETVITSLVITEPTNLALMQVSPGSAIQATTPTTFTVTNTGDEPDVNPGNGVCETGVGNGICTLRAAIQEINARDGGDTIRFSINPNGSSVVPRIIKPVISNSTMQIKKAVSILGPNATVYPGAGAPIQIDGSLTLTDTAWSGIEIKDTSHVRIANLTVFGFPGSGVRINNSSFVTITGNILGYKPVGIGPSHGNMYYGVSIINSHNCQIGGQTAALRNTVSGNLEDGIFIYNSTAVTVEGNYIGLNTAGTAAVPNGGDGIWVQGCSNLVGGTSSGARNIISGNARMGIRLQGTSDAAVTGNLIRGNYIGLSPDGATAIPNATGGINVGSFSYFNFIGGRSTSGEGNTVSGNQDVGIYITSADTRGNLVQGNRVGTDPSGIFAIPNSGAGISDYYSPGNQIGGSDPGLGNIISGNLAEGIVIYGSGAHNNTISANRIGLSATGLPLGNGRDGILVWTGQNIIGNTTSGAGAAGNVIAYNGRRGISYWNVNTILGNSIYANGLVEIDYTRDGSTANDPSGDKLPQNHPVISQAIVSGNTVTITGSIVTSANITVTLEFFVSDGYDPSGCGQGQAYVGNKVVAVGGTGTAVFTAILTHGSVRQGVYAATATSTALGTSEFSCAPHRVLVPVVRK